MPADDLRRFTARDDSDGFAACQRLANAQLPAHRLRLLLAAADGHPANALALPAARLSAPDVGLNDKQIQRVQEAASAPLPPRLMERAASLAAWVVCVGDADYPQSLVPLDDAPPLLFVRGALSAAADAFSVAVVGSRRATTYGWAQAERFARAFVEQGLVVVSGGAAGIDTAAHRGVVEAGGRTIAVMGCGLDVSYPAENRMLFAQIVDRGGALLSEFPMETKPEPWRFPTRNRIIAGITQATLIVETPDASGALITARNAGEYGRDVWVVPGPIDNARSRGGHKLIQDGAGLADSPDDVLRGLGIAVAEDTAPAPKPAASTRTKPTPKAVTRPDAASAPLSLLDVPPAPPPANLSPDEAALYATFTTKPRHLDEAGGEACLSASQAAIAATLLEMKSLIRRHPGNLFERRT